MDEKSKQVIRFSALSEKLGNVSRSTIFRWEREKKFPQHISLGPNCTGWLLHEVEEWIATRRGN